MLPTRLTQVAALLLLATASLPVAAEFDAAGYHDAKCMACHGTEVYTHDNRRITSMQALESQVARCDANLGTQLFPDELALLAEHLNTSFYKFSE